jgi:hypothetical protein
MCTENPTHEQWMGLSNRYLLVTILSYCVDTMRRKGKQTVSSALKELELKLRTKSLISKLVFVR